jgi:hypothetical protein
MKKLLHVGLLATLLVGAFAFLPSGAKAAPVPWSDSLAEYGMPSTPQMWQPPNWDVQIHTRDMENSGNSMDPQC